MKRSLIGWWLAALVLAFCIFFAWRTPTRASHKPSGANGTALAVWRQTLLHTPLHELGCFHAAYPQTAWKSVPCGTSGLAPGRLLARALSGRFAKPLSDAYSDYVLKVPQQNTQLVSAMGSFTSFTDSASSGTGADVLYSLQIRTLLASPSDACDGRAGCRVGVSFAYNNDSESDPYFKIPPFAIYIQYFLLNYNTDGKGCPTGWTAYSETGCMRFSDSKATLPGGIAYKDLSKVYVKAFASGKVDQVMVVYAGQSYAVTSPDDVVGISKIWDGAEFNIFGQGSTLKLFSPGVAAGVKLQATYSNGSSQPPLCVKTSDLIDVNGNNLNLDDCNSAGNPPQITFTESL